MAAGKVLADILGGVVDKQRSDVRGYLLDAAGMASANLGLARRHAGGLRLGLFSYWINTYTGAGIISALGGALVLGALPRLIRSHRSGYSLFLGCGVILLAGTRPYEGMLLCIPVSLPWASGYSLERIGQPCGTDSLRRASDRPHRRCRVVDGLLRLPCLRQFSYTALHSESRDLLCGSLFRVAATTSRTGVSSCCDADFLYPR